MSNLKFEISPELKGQYVVINTTSPILESRIGRIDFRRITKAQAEELIKKGTRYLRKIEKPVEPEKKTAKS